MSRHGLECMTLNRLHSCPTVAFRLLSYHQAHELDVAMLVLQACQNYETNTFVVWFGFNDQVLHVRVVQRRSVFFFWPAGNEVTILLIALRCDYKAEILFSCSPQLDFHDAVLQGLACQAHYETSGFSK